MTWQLELVSTVRNPPIRSAMKPQSWRPIKPKASSTDNIALPRVTGIPTSLQNAARWPCGIAIGTQHINYLR
jgi:hypothetical protein